jgi:hypothetical protein
MLTDTVIHLQAQQFLLLHLDNGLTHTTRLASSARRLVCVPLSAKPLSP